MTQEIRKQMDKDIAFFKKTLPAPEPMDITLVKANVEIIKDSKHEDGRLKVNVLKSSIGMSGYCWCGMLVKDLYRGFDWCGVKPKERHLEKVMSKQPFVYLAMYGGWNTTVSVMLWHGRRQKEWECIWDACNNFESFAKTKKRHKAYNDLIKNEGKKIARLIDEKKSYKFIESRLKKCHSSATHAWSWDEGIKKAKNKKYAEEIRKKAGR